MATSSLRSDTSSRNTEKPLGRLRVLSSVSVVLREKYANRTTILTKLKRK